MSVPANLSEGVGRGTAGERVRFVQVALGSLYELDTLLHIAVELGYASPSEAEPLREQVTTLAKRTSSFIRYKEAQR